MSDDLITEVARILSVSDRSHYPNATVMPSESYYKMKAEHIVSVVREAERKINYGSASKGSS